MNSFGRISIAIVTPFVKPINSTICQIIDEQSLISTIKHVAKGLSNTRDLLISKSSSNLNINDIIGGIIIPGTTGEQHSLSIEEKKRLYEISVETSSVFNINTLAGVSAVTTYDAIELAKHAVKVGVKEDVRQVVPLSIPILLYNNVIRNSVGISKEGLISLFNRGIICGVKHANTPDLFLTEAKVMMKMEPKLKLYTGSDIQSSVLINPLSNDVTTVNNNSLFYGLTSIIGNIYPEEVSYMIAGHVLSEEESGINIDKARFLHQQLSNVTSAVLGKTSIPVGLKYAMRQMCLNNNNKDIDNSNKDIDNFMLGGYPRLPLHYISDENKDDIKNEMNKFNTESIYSRGT